MSDRSWAFELTRRILRAIPNAFPGKSRMAQIALRLVPSQRMVRVPDRFGNRLWCPSLKEPIAAALFADGVYEPGTFAAILARLPVEGSCLDVGANIGAIALPLAACRPRSKIICVEADPGIVAVLRRNVAENRRANAIVVECLAGPSSQPGAAFYPAPQHKFGMGSVGPQFDVSPVMLGQRKLDDVLDELGIQDLDVVKLDVEGAELGALQGLERRLSGQRPPAIVFEFLDWAEARVPGQSPGDAQRYLLALGYRLFRLAQAGRETALDGPLTAGGAMIVATAPQAGQALATGHADG